MGARTLRIHRSSWGSSVVFGGGMLVWVASARAAPLEPGDWRVERGGSRDVMRTEEVAAPMRQALAVGVVVRDDRGEVGSRRWLPGFVLESDFALARSVLVRLSFVTPARFRDELAIYGPMLDLQGVVRMIRGPIDLEIGLGPSLWLGGALGVDPIVPGPFPGVRASVGVGWRWPRMLGLRIEGGHARHWGARSELTEISIGWDVRAMMVVWSR